MNKALEVETGLKRMIKTLAHVQRELKAPKDQKNDFGGYLYRTAEDILAAVKPLLPEDVIVLTREKVKVVDGWHYVQCTSLITDGEHEVTANGHARETMAKKGMDDSQVTGTASSYAEKRALGHLFMISSEVDADSSNAYEREVEEMHRLLTKAKDTKADTEAHANACLDFYIFGQDMDAEDTKNTFFAYQTKYALKGGKGRLKNSIKEVNEEGLRIALQYRDLFMEGGDEATEAEAELTRDQAEYIRKMVEFETVTQ